MKKLSTILGGILLVILISANAGALPMIQELIVDGDFETGIFATTVWDRNPELSESSWVINDDSPTILPDGTLAELPISGTYDAMLVAFTPPSAPDFLPNTNRLYQSFGVPSESITSATLSWNYRIKNYYDQFIEDEQEFRVEIWDDDDALVERIFSMTTPDDSSILPPSTEAVDPDNPWSFDMTNILSAYQGQSLTLSFIGIDSQERMVVNLDNVSLAVQIESTPVPEPATILLLSTGLIGFAGYGRIRRQRS